MRYPPLCVVTIPLGVTTLLGDTTPHGCDLCDFSPDYEGGLAGESWSCAFDCKPVIRTGWYLKFDSEGLIDGALLIVGVVGGITVDTDFAST